MRHTTPQPFTEARPTAVPCDVCAAMVDPVRAPYVAVIDERYRYYCTRECRDRGRARAHRPGDHPARTMVPARPSVVEVAAMLGLPRASLPPEVTDPHAVAPSLGDDDGAPVVFIPDVPPDPTLAAIALAVAVLAALVAALDGGASLRAGVLGLLAAAGIGIAAGTAWRAWQTDSAGGAVGVVAAMVPMAALPRTANQWVDALRDAALVASVVPLAAWAVAARRSAGRRRLEAFRSSLASRASVVRGELTEVIEAARVRVGEEVEVGAGMTVPVDGIVRAGEGRVLLYPAAAEPRRRVPGDAVLAGARVIDGAVRVLATRAGDEVAWARLGRLLGDGAERPRVVSLALRAAMVAPAVLAVTAIVAAVARELLGAGSGAETAAWLLALAPCAGAAALVELPFVDALGTAARKGIVFRDASGVEAAAQVGTVVLCTRGTVTSGRLEVTEVVPLGARTEEEILALAAAAEEVAAGDPIARALSEAAAKRGVRLESVRRPVRVPGQGITAVGAGGEALALGNRRLLLAEGVPVSPAEGVAVSIEGAGRTAVLLAVDGRVEGVVGFEDPVRDEARSAVQAMMDAGVDVALLGGASRGTLEAIGAMLDVANLRPEVLPEERAGVVRAMSEVGSGVAVVGRAGRDSSALAAADVAISIEAAGGAGGETAVALASDDLRDAAAALQLARRARERALAVLVVGAVAAGVAALVVVLAPGWGALAVCVGFTAMLATEALGPREE